MAMITNDWLTALGGEFHKPYYRQLFEFVKNEYNTTVVFPPADDIFNAFHLTPLSKVKVVILGQDPYHNVGQAHGLCFSVKPDVEIPPSLVNIYQELHDDLGCYIPNNGYLVKWAEQGVLMLNTVLTVRAHMANSHHGKGWEEFTDAAIRALNAQDRPIVFILWGRPAQMKKAMLNNPNHLILEAPHPSPLSAYRGFFGSRPFSKTNKFLKEHGVEAPFEKVVTVVGMMKDRVSFIKELWDVCSFFFVAPTEYDEKTVKKRWKEDSAKCMTELAEVIAGIEDFSIEGQEKVVMDWIAEKGYHTGNIMNAFRLTLVGEGKGPHMFDISWVLGKEETIARMKRAVEVLK